MPKSHRTAILIAFACTLIALATLAIPLYVIRPFVPQDPNALQFALEVRILAPWLSILCATIVVIALFISWSTSRWPTRSLFLVAALFTLPTVIATRINIFEKMFHPNLSPSFDAASSAAVDPTDMLLAISLGGHARAYPIRTMGYHHIINDTLNGQPIAITYCTLCHTGLVWSRVLDGRTLHFRLAGINNGNALLRDEETKSIWQQSTGESIFGTYRGRHLTLVPSNELTFATWHAENPGGDVLHPDASTQALYDPKDWERHVESTHVVIDTKASGIDPHELMFALNTNAPHAYPIRALLSTGLIEDKHVMLLLGPDQASIRAFDPGTLTFVREASLTPAAYMIDSDTGSTWNFSGCSVSGKLTGQCLPPLDGHKTFWFDWLNHHSDTTVYRG